MKIISRSQRGYTLIEVLVVVAIIGILSGISYLGLSGGTGRESTRAASLEVKGAVRNAQEQALTSKLDSSGQPADHYGVRFINQVAGSNPPVWQGYEIIRIERCGSLSNATTVSRTTLPTGVTLSTSPSNLNAITFQKNKGTTHFFDGSTNPIGDNEATVTANGNGTYTVMIFQDTGRVD